MSRIPFLKNVHAICWTAAVLVLCALGAEVYLATLPEPKSLPESLMTLLSLAIGSLLGIAANQADAQTGRQVEAARRKPEEDE